MAGAGRRWRQGRAAAVALAAVFLVVGLATAVAAAVTTGASPAANGGSTSPPVAYQLNPGHTGATTDPRGPDWTPAWTANLSGAASYPVIADSRVFVLAGTAAATLSAYDSATGVLDWTVAVGNEPTGLAYDDDQLFEQSGAVLSAFDPVTGAENWTSTLPYQYFFSSAPTADDGIVYTNGAAGGGTLYAVSETTGALLWAAQNDEGGDSSPAVDSSGVYESFGCDLTDDHNPQSGAQVWQYETGCEGGGGQTAVLAGADLYLRDRVLDAATGTSVRALAAGPAPAVDATNIYSENGGVLQAQPIGSGPTSWSFTGDGTLDTAPIVDDGVVYEGSGDGDLYGLAAATGQLLWSTKLPSSISAPFNYDDDSFWGLAEGDGLLAVPDGNSLVVFSQTAAPPAAPPAATATPSAAGTMLTWTVPADNGSPIDAFTVSVSDGGVAQTPVVFDAGAVGTTLDPTPGSTDSYTLAGWSESQGDAFAVAADNAGGVGSATPAAAASLIVSFSTTAVVPGVGGTFTVTAFGTPVPALSETGALPSGLTFTDRGDGTAALAGTPAPGTFGSYPLTFTATNGVGAAAVQQFTLVVGEPPVFTSAPSATITAGAPPSFTFTATGSPAPQFWAQGLPDGVTVSPAGALVGPAAPGTGGIYHVIVGASNGVGPTVVQSFTLTVDATPAFTSNNTTEFTQGQAGSFSVTESAFPTGSITEAGTLPSGVSFAANANGTASLTGTPALGTFGSYPLTFTATNGVGAAVVQDFTFIVGEPPTFTSSAAVTFTDGASNSFPIAASGYPAPTFTAAGTLPLGVSLSSTGVLTAERNVDGGVYPITVVATNDAAPSATQDLVLTIDQPAVINSPPSDLVRPGIGGSWTFTATGYPAPSFQESGAVPTGLTFTDNGNGTAALTGVAAADTLGTYPMTITATNSTGAPSVQDFILTVGDLPTITSAAATTFTVGVADTFPVVAAGVPTPTITVGGPLPGGLTLSANGSITGTPTPGTGRVYTVPLIATNAVGSVTQDLVLTVDEAPTVTSGAAATFVFGLPYSATVTASGYPTPTIAETGTLPGGITLVDNGNGTARLSGTSADTTAGTWPFTITASNGVGPRATQSFVLNIKRAPLWITADSATMTVGGTSPIIGAQYIGFHDGDTAANLTSSPVCTTTATDKSAVGLYPSTCSGAVDPDYVMTYFMGTVAVQRAFSITTTTLPAATPGAAYHVQLQASGGRRPYRWSTTSSLPTGLHLTDAGRIAGQVTPGLPAGSYTLIVSARTPGSKKNPAQTTSAPLTLTVN